MEKTTTASLTAKKTMIGQRLNKPDAPDKATGKTRYINDMVLPQMLIGKVLFAGRPHARIARLDTTAAEKLPGVHAVLTGKDVAGLKFGFVRDNVPLKDKVRCEHDEIAAVAAETEEIAQRALELIEVEYEDLPGVFTPEDGAREGAPQIHDNFPGNKSLHFEFKDGDLAEAEAASDFVVDNVFRPHHVTHCCMGTSCAIADFDHNGKLTIWTQTQYPYNYKMDLAPALGIHPGNIRVIQPPVGGAFGSKLDVYPYEPIAALLAKKTARPVKVMYSREEEFKASPTRQSAIIHMRTGCTRDGTLTFRTADVLMDNGAYTSWGPTIPVVMMRTVSGHYRVPVVDFKAQAIYTNNPYAGSFRGYGNVQAAWATAQQMDMLADLVDIDPLEFHLKNAQKSGEVTPQKSILNECVFVECLETAAAASDYGRKRKEYAAERNKPGRYKKGIGLASSIHNAGGAKIHKSDGIGTILKVDDYARVTVITGASEIGQGIDVVIMMIVAEELGVPPEHVTIVNNDSDIAPWDVGVHASRTTFIAGNGTRRAAQKARAQILNAAARALGELAEDLDLRDGSVVRNRDGAPLLKLERLMRQMHFQPEPELVMVTDYYEPNSEPEGAKYSSNSSAAYSHAVHIAEITVDTLTGEIKVDKVTVAQDVGRVINRMGLEGQIEGGIAIGLGYALSEDMRIEKGMLKNPCFRDYKLITAPEIPTFDLHFIESYCVEGPYGAKGISELPTIVIAPAIANALYNATGVRIFNPPMSPEKVARAIHERRVQATSPDGGVIPS
ncbi:molybdopterin binding aldehyde oxidase and xanthine dehydrogenase [Paramagnetospirillum caucaseum]|uniref:Molybdopterin binding aldehyde oxidase and xanthine dehydrogenase n=1 Tax=Paramagnetospirillum caucaseum TaxID=1244869 RepID=M2Z4I9_9PROT|nr:xanthine dehydrogenase family protein molybdopterin-binding subunit [Paramagnetospirillum caucaseum]EME69280.1 molybdopterin binding aldehyde oxidase and xanthine dehydrogenase [Paramagnetospirillum caucaseum]